MQSPLKRVAVFDLETGGLKHQLNSITEFAGVAIELETLEIVEEFSVMIRPYMDLSNRLEEPIKEAKILFNNLSQRDEESKVRSLIYKDQVVTLKTLSLLEEDIREFNEEFPIKDREILSYEDYLEILETDLADIGRLYFNQTYNPEALEITHISIEMLLAEGIDIDEARKKITAFLTRHTVGNSKPILAGHNIKGFDLDFLELFYAQAKEDLNKLINKFSIDTLEWARIRWFELPSFSLGVCANAIGLTLKEAHRALPDTIANAKFLIKMLKSLRGEGSQESTYVRRKLNFNF